MPQGTFMIGEAAARAGVSPDTIRHYERLGVLPPAPRTENGYRYYSEASVERVLFIRNAMRFGFGMKELAGFLKARDAGRPPCRAVRAAGERILTEMDRQLAELTAARSAMAQTLAAWDARLERTPSGAPANLLCTAAPARGHLSSRLSLRNRGR
jgi:DNA-binding transcriptional MerR regulator